MSMEFTDRYQAMGIPYPDAETMCKGQCEGTGVYPHYVQAFDQTPRTCITDDYPETPAERTAWEEAHKQSHSTLWLLLSLFTHREWWYWKSVLRDIVKGAPCDGYHFIKCPDCNGTGKAG